MESVPGTLVSVITTVNTKHPVVMVALNESTVAMYGADADEEGAVLIIYNIQFKLVQAVQKLKLFTSDAKLWKIEDKLLLAANRHLAIAPYSLAPQRIEAMLGSTLHFKNDASAEDDIVVIQESTVADWGTITSDEMNHRISVKGLKKSIATQVSTYLREGMSDAAIHRNLIPQLIEAKDVSSILWCLDNLKDLPEELLIQLLSFCLRESYNNDITKQNNVKENSSNDMYESAQNQFLSKIIDICYTDISVISYLRTGLSFDEILKLLSYLIDKLNEENSSDNLALEHEYKTNNQVYEWIGHLIDSHYQHYLLSQDGQVYKLLNKLNEALQIQVSIIHMFSVS